MKNIFVLIVSAIMLSGCSSTKMSPTDIDSILTDARQTMDIGDLASAQSMCDKLLGVIYSPDSMAISSAQAFDLALLYVRLSELSHSDEQMAEATICLRFALRQSPDSLSQLSAELPIEEATRYELLQRISISLDSPLPFPSDTIPPDSI